MGFVDKRLRITGRSHGNCPAHEAPCSKACEETEALRLHVEKSAPCVNGSNNKSRRRVSTPLGILHFRGKARSIIYASEHLFDKKLRK